MHSHTMNLRSRNDIPENPRQPEQSDEDTDNKDQEGEEEQQQPVMPRPGQQLPPQNYGSFGLCVHDLILMHR